VFSCGFDPSVLCISERLGQIIFDVCAKANIA
jgi:hypothetical protein